mmetsp:Transcript_1022/g.2260  ORF Transcript_1022/g.2260 Transcript_1022/m.2260 type:complete len:207 (+) Transcript_1022:327-947(+)
MSPLVPKLLSAISPATSACVSSVSTFTLIRSKASMEEDPPISDSMSFTFMDVFAVRARAIIVSFCLLASVILVSSAIMLTYSFSAAPVCITRPLSTLSKFSCWIWRLESASRARSSSPFSIASWARLYQSAALASACCLCFSIRFCVAEISAYDCLTLMRSFCMSITACSITFSGSSKPLITLFTFAETTRAIRSNMFIDVKLRRK